MPLIRVLPEHLRNVIAAGEVIERPASVVKELIENSVDGGAKNITVEVLYGGKKLIRVIDDGSGMDREDAILSIQRYATSKISSIEDLFRLQTLGFRGEALASIASVSRLSIETGIDSSEPATFVEVVGGEVKAVRDAPPFKGTIVTVRDLFFNTPARRKFLKANSTELNYILETVITEALAEYKLGFKVFAEDTELLFYPPAYEPRERIVQVMGMEVMENMEEFENEHEGMRLHAFISRPPELRAKKTGQYLFINQRPVKDHIITRAIYDGLSELLPQGKHPLFVVYFSIDPSKVDFNVHPTKKEVRFSDSSSVYEFIKASVEKACVRRITKIQFQDSPSESFQGVAITSEAVSPYQPSDIKDITQGLFTGASTHEGESLTEVAEKDILFFGEIFIIIARPDGLLILDKHAAHERVLYERFLEGTVIPKRLLFPKQVKLQPVYYRHILKNREMLREMGLEIDDFGSDTVLVRTVPEFYKDESLHAILEEIGSILKDHEEGMEHKVAIFEKKKALAERLACHKSVRRGDPVTKEEIDLLYRELLKTSDPYHCPHGRPTIVKITIQELLKRFGRV